MTTVAVVTSCTGQRYWRFLPEWAAAVAALTRKPDQVVVVTDADSEIRDQASAVLRGIRWVRPRTVPQVHRAVVVNDAIEATVTEWVSKADVDDVLLPHALDGIDDCDADVFAFGYRYNNRDHVIAGITAAQVLRCDSNPLSSVSPFRRWLWERHRFDDCLYDDWAFWLRAAANGATFAGTGRVDYVYRIHEHQATAHLNHWQARAFIDELRRSLC